MYSLVPHRIILCYNASYHITSHHIASHHITSPHISSHNITSHNITSHHITSHNISLHLITSHHITSHHITTHHITPHHIISHHITSHHITGIESSALRCDSAGHTHCVKSSHQRRARTQRQQNLLPSRSEPSFLLFFFPSSPILPSFFYHSSLPLPPPLPSFFSYFLLSFMPCFIIQSLSLPSSTTFILLFTILLYLPLTALFSSFK